MNPLIFIPARMASKRLPNKPLADIAGKSMIQHVWERANDSGVGKVYVAAGDQQIVDAVENFGGQAVLVDRDVPTGSDRIHAALEIVDPEHKHDIVINLQGDSPTIEPELLPRLLDPFQDPAVDLTTLVTAFAYDENVSSTNKVKAVVSEYDTERKLARCLYFSRNLVPHNGPYWHHVGVYGFRRAALDTFVRMPRTPLEKSENLEQLRALEAGMIMHAAIVDTFPLGVDTLQDLEMARQILGY